MNTYPKLKKEFTKEEIISQYENNEIDINFIAEYISKQDSVYNKLIDRANFLEKENEQLKRLNKIVYVDESKKGLDELEKWLSYNWECNKTKTGLYNIWVTWLEVLRKIKELKKELIDNDSMDS